MTMIKCLRCGIDDRECDCREVPPNIGFREWDEDEGRDEYEKED